MKDTGDLKLYKSFILLQTGEVIKSDQDLYYCFCNTKF